MKVMPLTKTAISDFRPDVEIPCSVTGTNIC